MKQAMDIAKGRVLEFERPKVNVRRRHQLLAPGPGKSWPFGDVMTETDEAENMDEHRVNS